jgi:hypothetical protein
MTKVTAYRTTAIASGIQEISSVYATAITISATRSSTTETVTRNNRA